MVLLVVLACTQPDPFTIRHAHRGAHTDPGDDTGLVDTSDDTGTDDTAPDDTAVDSTDTQDTGDADARLYGVDVSGWDPGIAWHSVAADGIAFAFMKSTEGTYYESDEFTSQYDGAAENGIVRGAYHFAIPDDSDGATQADYFIDHGGGWSPDDITLPGALDIEYNPYGSTCYDLTKSEMAAWIADFNDEYDARTGRYPVVYSTANWWDSCVGSGSFGRDNPLWVAHYDVSAPSLQDGWSDYSFWQYSSTETVSGIPGGVDANVFKGDIEDLVQFANDG